MSDELSPLGEKKAWLVDAFPIRLREEINRAAKASGTTVPLWLVAHFERFGIDGLDISQFKLSPPNPPLAISGPASFPPVREAVEAVIMLSSIDGAVEPATLKAANALLRKQLSEAKLSLAKPQAPEA